MLVIRLARGGRNKYPTYRIVAAEKRFAATGRYVEVLGRYNPHTKELVMDKEAIERRVGQGAQPSNTVLKLMQREGMTLPKWAKIEQKQRAPKKEVEAEATEEAAASEVEAAAEASDAADTQAADAKDKAEQATEADASAQEAAADAAEAVTKEEAAKEA